MELVRARIIHDGCPECRDALLAESKSLGGLPLGGIIVEIPEHWLNATCHHDRTGLKFELVVDDTVALAREAERTNSDDVEVELIQPGMDATKDIGYPVREHGPYGSHPAHDDFDDESGADEPGKYTGLERN
jgi:hypothetical protein